ncbi:MAG: hypothetical protein K8R31_11965 [Bacteroidales bacterium]|nr:hypothetical protein [Bacteroidales bacterium]
MKRKIFKTMILLIMLAGVFFTACEDEFTEKDALDAQQTIDVSIYVYDPATDSSLVNAAVTMVNGGEAITIQTNELGIAYFTKIKIGDNVLVRIEKEGYIKRLTDFDISTDNYRQSQYMENIALYSLTQNTATIKGKLEIETDLTNDETEYAPEGTKVYAYLTLDGTPVEFIATVDANGKYEFTVPADYYGVYYELRYSSLELSQTIAKNGNEGDPDFPETLPSIVDINTVFNSSGYAISIPYVRSVYAVVDNSATHDETAIIYNVDVNSDGEVYDIDFSDNGSGYTDISVDVNIVSLFGGSGAVISVDVSGGYLYDWDVNITDGGSGYPTFDYANQASIDSPYLPSYVYNLKSGEIRIVNGDYGTGVYRDEEIQ